MELVESDFTLVQILAEFGFAITNVMDSGRLFEVDMTAGRQGGGGLTSTVLEALGNMAKGTSVTLTVSVSRAGNIIQTGAVEICRANANNDANCPGILWDICDLESAATSDGTG